ncbi:DNA-binding protein [Novilysobacter arseniciresistens]|uniref:DNA-binding protein n=1 Tax=Novilysobacter arseniciresistens TaxID=1385522 RepID=UPI0009DFBC9C|nr:DNA-binding protein [Lysobacter arseniciresistens]
MARGISEKDVHSAADALVASGERPTVERIRAHLGTGSPNTVVRWLDTWWKALGSRLQDHELRLDLPAAPEAVAALAGRWWALSLEHAQIAAEAALAAQREVLEADRATLQQERDTFAEEAVSLRSQRADALQARNVSIARASELERQVGQLEVQIETLKGQLEAAVARARSAEDERRTAEVRAQTLHEQMSSERDSLTRHVQAVEDRAHREVDGARQEARELKRQLAVELRERAASQADHRQQLDKLHAEATDARRDAAAQRAKAEALEAQLVHLRDLPAALESAMKRAKATPRKASRTAPARTRSAKSPSKTG